MPSQKEEERGKRLLSLYGKDVLDFTLGKENAAGCKKRSLSVGEKKQCSISAARGERKEKRKKGASSSVNRPLTSA